MFKQSLTAAAILFAASAQAADVPITGNVASKCTIYTDTQGVYGNPLPNTLSTLPADGGVKPVIRYDVVNGGMYKAVIATPDEFSASPNLDDVLAWEGSVAVAEVSDAQMSDYENNKVLYDNVTEIELTVAGSTWFDVTSSADYGVGKALPGGTYRALVSAECIAL